MLKRLENFFGGEVATEIFQGFPTSLEAEYWSVNIWKELSETEEKYSKEGIG